MENGNRERGGRGEEFLGTVFFSYTVREVWVGVARVEGKWGDGDGDGMEGG